jgi:phytoene dehydrogenase-like protein
VHVGGTAEEIARSEAAANAGTLSDAPFVLLAQQSHVDDSRAPASRHTGWAYCHVPHGADADMTDRIERQIERFAPGFRDIILARHVMYPRAVEAHNANMIGADIGGGHEYAPTVPHAADALESLYHFRPTPVPSLQFDTSGRRRSRHVWLLGSEHGASSRLQSGRS